jgi:hypothetical protein
MGILIQIGALARFLAPDFVWLGILAPLFFTVIGIAGTKGLIASRGSIRAFALSVLLAYLASVAITLPDTFASAPPSEPVRSLKCGSRFSGRQVQDAAE